MKFLTITLLQSLASVDLEWISPDADSTFQVVTDPDPERPEK
jgi:hypothetical protein